MMRKLIVIIVSFLFFFSAIVVQPAYSRGGGGDSLERRAEYNYHYDYRDYYHNDEIDKIKNKAFPTEEKVVGSLIVLVILATGIFSLLYWRQLYNLVVYKKKKFSDNGELIKFVSNINSRFKNAYSLYYVKDEQLWLQEEKQTEIEEFRYSCVISKKILVEKVRCLFDRYQKDWTNKDFRAIEQYTFEPFKSQQREIYHQSCGENIDIVYDCQLSAVVPIQFEMREDLKRFVMQINGQMINFKISPRGYVISGKSEHRLFTEYWDVALDAENKCYLVIIHQVQQ